MKRQSGILLHITSLKNDEGIGSLGQEAFEFIDWLCEANFSCWQMLPIGPTGYGDSPYSSFSAFAGNPYLINIKSLYDEGWLEKNAYTDYLNLIKKNAKENKANQNKVDYGLISFYKTKILKSVAEKIYTQKKTNKDLQIEIEQFYKEEKFWLNDFAIFMLIKDNLISYNKNEIKEFTKIHFKEIELNKIIQFLFFKQWSKLKNYSAKKGIKLIGDIPIFVAPDSADVWANQELFMLDENSKPIYVAGVPPDFFSETGQLWGNPLYNWKKMKENKYRWWKARFKHILKLFDIVRIDHFRGFESFWAIPSNSKNAINGEWLPAPKHHFFKEIKRSLGKLNSEYLKELPIIAEDLGIITEEVTKLRKDFNFPGMKILQFAFNEEEWKAGKIENPYLPHNISKNSVIYTGTHDNDSLIGFLENFSLEKFEFVFFYIYGKKPTQADYKKFNTAKGKEEMSNKIIKLCLSSIADLAILQMQDILYEGKDSKMNTPATIGSNWQWRQNKFPPSEKTTNMLKNWNILYSR